jgi:NAD(P)-dependent dehydrogenase (short-subunit alcohol dehydrogenase family)
MKPDYQFDAESSYVVAGGLGGLGRSAARWMASQGAKHLILLSRSGAQSQALIAMLEDLKSMGVHVTAPACDVSDKNSLSAVLAECARTSPAIKGAIQASMVLKVRLFSFWNIPIKLICLQDSTLEEMTIEDWQLSIKPKVDGSWNLHTLLPTKMDFFICLSSISGIIGMGGQANYAAGNTFVDALVRYRVAHGEKATSLDLGWMESEGVIAESTFLSTGIASAGHLLPISQAEFHALLNYHCDPARELAPEDSCQSIIGPEVPAAMLEKGLKEPSWMQRPTFRHLRQIGLGGVSSSLAGKVVDYAALLREAASVEEAARVVIDGLVQKLSRALSIPAENLDISKPLHACGVDSLLTVELRNYFAKKFGADVTVFEISGGSSFQAVSMTVTKKSKSCSSC